MINTGSRVMVNENLQVGLGVVEEQLRYAGREMIVDHVEPFGIYLKGCDFYWKFCDIKEVE